MPYVPVSGTDFQYALIAYDADGAGRTNDRDGRMSQRLLESVARDPVSDLFIMCHGPLLSGNSIAGPILTTQSRFDTAVGRWYPLGAGAARQPEVAHAVWSAALA